MPACEQAGITEPSGNSLFNELMHTRDRAVGAASSRQGADKLQHRTDQELGARDARGRKHEVDFGAYRHHADAIAPKYAGKRTLPIVHHEIPKMDPKVGALMHDLGEAHPQRGAHLRAHAQLKAEGKAATSQLAARPAPAHVPGEEMAVQEEIAAAKKAARNPTYRAAFKPRPRGLFRGGNIEENVEREIAAARRGAHHHLPYGRVPGHGEAAGVCLCMCARERDACPRACLDACWTCQRVLVACESVDEWQVFPNIVACTQTCVLEFLLACKQAFVRARCSLEEGQAKHACAPVWPDTALWPVLRVHRHQAWRRASARAGSCSQRCAARR